MIQLASRMLGVLLLASAAHAVPVTFSDGTFADVNWSAAKLIDSTAGAAATFSAGQGAAGGNPGSYRQVTHTFNVGDIFVGHLLNAAVYDPAVSGAIATIDYGYDLISLNPSPNEQVFYAILLFQNGTYYRSAGEVVVTSPSWSAFSRTGLVATQFIRMVGSGPAAPDFSASASPVTAGYWSANTSTGGLHTTVSLIDNWTIRFNPVVTPEPEIAVLLAIGLACLAGRARR